MRNEKLQNNLNLKEIVKKDGYIENDPTLYFDTIPIHKVIILTVVTFGFYEIILFYNWWKKLKIDFGYKISPFWRAIFSGITVFWLFPIFEKYFKFYNIKAFNAGLYATIYFICSWVSSRLSLFADKNTFTEVMSWLFSFCGIATIVIVQTKINEINERYYPTAKKNNWKLSNIIWTIICSIMLILSIFPQSNNISENTLQNKSTQDEQTMYSKASYSRQENINNIDDQYNNEKQQLFQHRMKMVAKTFAKDLEATQVKCKLSSSELAQCFAGKIAEISDLSVSDNIMIFMNDKWEFYGDGVCNNNENCKIKITSHSDTNIKATISIYVNENGYITVE